MKIYEEIFDSWQSALRAEWQSDENNLKAKDATLVRVWLMIGIALPVSLLGLGLSALFGAIELAILFLVFMLIDVVASVLVRVLWNRPFQKEVIAYEDNLSLGIFETLTMEKGISASRWKLVLDCVLSDCDRQESKRKNVMQVALTLITSVYVGVMAANLWEAVKEASSIPEAIATVSVVLTILVIFACAITWMIGDAYDRLILFRKRNDLVQFAHFIEKGLFEQESLDLLGNAKQRILITFYR